MAKVVQESDAQKKARQANEKKLAELAESDEARDDADRKMREDYAATKARRVAEERERSS